MDAEGVAEARELGKAAFGTATDDTAAIVPPVQVGTVNLIPQAPTPAFPLHPASPAAAESLRIQRSTVSGEAAVPTTENPITGRSEVQLSASRNDSPQPVSAAATTALDQTIFNVVMPATGLSNVVSAEGASSDMVKNLLRSRAVQSDIGQGNGTSASSRPDGSNIAMESQSPLNIHQQQSPDGILQHSSALDSATSLSRAVAAAAAASSSTSMQLASTRVSNTAAPSSSPQQRESPLAPVNLVVLVSAGDNPALTSLLGVSTVLTTGLEQPVLVSTAPQAAATAATPSARNVNAATLQSSQYPSPVSTADIRELEAFVESFKMRRMDLGYTQTNVGKALEEFHGTMFSQTTVCRFENMQLSYPNAVKLRPLIASWMKDALPRPNGARKRSTSSQSPATTPTSDAKAMAATAAEPMDVTAQSAAAKSSGAASSAGAPVAAAATAHSLADSPPGRRSRNGNHNHRTTIPNAARETLEKTYETYPKPTPKQMEDLASELELCKSTVRIWFCNRRQRENRMRAIMYKSGMC